MTGARRFQLATRVDEVPEDDGDFNALDSDDGSHQQVYFSSEAEMSEEDNAQVQRRPSKHAQKGAGTLKFPTLHGQDHTETPDELLPRDRPPKSAFFDAAHERKMTQAEAKQLYQRHQLESMTSSFSHDPHSPVIHERTSTFGYANDGNHSTMSLRSRQSLGPTSQPIVEPQFGSTSLADFARPGPSEPGPNGQNLGQDQYLKADLAARSHALHPGVPHESKGSMLEKEGLHGAGAGIGMGGGAAGFAAGDAYVAAELSAIYANSEFSVLTLLISILNCIL